MERILAENRRAKFDYDISETLAAGIELRGFEVKSAKTGKMILAGAYAIIRGGEVWLVNAQIPPYQPGNAPADYDPARPRRLLLNRVEIAKLAGATKTRGVSLVALDAHLSRNMVKIQLGVGRSRKKYDKREALKKKDIARARQRGIAD